MPRVPEANHFTSGEDTHPLLPADAALLPLTSGQLLVSPAYAVFCRVPNEDIRAVSACLQGELASAQLPGHLVGELRRHGFGSPPREPAPAHRTVQLQLTNDCNLACSYCCTNSGRPRQREVTREELLRVVKEVRAVMGPGISVALLGGEPLLVPWALELGTAILDHELRLTLFTNGLLLADEAIAAQVAALIQRGAKVRVSLAAATREQCDALSGAERFDGALRGLATLARFGARAGVDLMLAPHLVDEVAGSLQSLRAQLPIGTEVALGVLYLSGRERGAHLFPSRAQLEAALDRVAFEAGELIEAPRPSPLAERREGCDCALGHHLHVRSDGVLFTCFKMEERVGHLAELAFADALDQLRTRARPARTLPRCEGCALNTLCGGGCRSDNLMYTGDADTPICGEWRVRIVSELLAEDHVTALEWPVMHLLAEAHSRGIEAPPRLDPLRSSRHLTET